MAVTQAQLLAALRLPDTPDSVQSALVTRIGTVAGTVVAEYAPSAPDDVKDEATIRVAGWLYDSDPADSRGTNPLRASGAMAILSPYRVQRATVLGTGTDTEKLP